MKKWLIRIGAFVLLVVLASAAISAIAQTQTAYATEEPEPVYSIRMQSDHFAINWSVVGSGGGDASSANFSISTTIGQPITGNSSSANFAHRAGFWQNFQDILYRIFVPLIQSD